ncbi:LON peptidase substrate-binding domain-containing protein [Anaeromyxobacter sp. SG17]|uniref:LON peptidase substrate-binding domain-containing protein n=1 Tax=Anaeromyxobacter sp. SG17 TaxID=2925405 RepID=UPI001F57E088|nr:LON peptidase substrate-binding domain-containing protein [Anaeromyxobacter sp. SG17]
MCAERIAPQGKWAALASACAALKVFPLHGVAVLPGTPTPFHVFEPRYKALVKDALAGDRVVAIPALYTKADAQRLRPRLKPICGAGIIEAEQEYPDGRYDILVRGLARVRLVEEHVTEKAYREWKAEILEEIWPQGGAAALVPELEALRQLVYELSTRLPAESGAPQLAEAVAQMSDPSAIVDLVGAAVVSDPESRQKVLEELAVARRLEYVLEEVAGVVLVLSKGKNPRV